MADQNGAALQPGKKKKRKSNWRGKKDKNSVCRGKYTRRTDLLCVCVCVECHVKRACDWKLPKAHMSDIKKSDDLMLRDKKKKTWAIRSEERRHYLFIFFLLLVVLGRCFVRDARNVLAWPRMTTYPHEQKKKQQQRYNAYYLQEQQEQRFPASVCVCVFYGKKKKTTTTTYTSAGLLFCLAVPQLTENRIVRQRRK